jgi:hypothetical protein
MTWGFADKRANDDYFLRRQTFSDNERYDNAKCKLRAEWRYKQGIFGSDTVRLTVQGHSQNGLPFASNARADIRSDKLAVNTVMYQSAVEYRQSETGDGISSTAIIAHKKDRLWAA